VAGAAAAGRGRKGSNLQRGERRSRWLITDAVVAGRWSWQHVVVLVAQGGAGGRDVDGGGSRRRRSAARRSKRGRRGERRGVCSTTGKRLLVQEKGFCGGYGGGKTSDGVLPVVAAVEGERKTEKQRKWQKPGRG